MPIPTRDRYRERVFMGDEEDSAVRRQRLLDAQARSAAQFADLKIPLYGLPSHWSGFRAVGSTSFERGTRHSAGRPPTVEVCQTVELIHQDGAAELRVESTNRRDVDEVQFDAAPATTTVVIDGDPVDFVVTSTSDELVARWVGPDATVTITARNWPGVDGLSLAQVTDPAPYQDGRRAMLEQRSGFDLR